VDELREMPDVLPGDLELIGREIRSDVARAGDA
jgi:hypothetical protein